MTLAKLHSKEHENPHVHTVKNMQHKYNHHIKEHKHIDSRVHPVWVMSPSPDAKSGGVASLNVANDDDVHGILFVITRMNPSTKVACLSTRRPIVTLT